MSAEGYTIIIAAVFLGLQQMLAMYLQYRREQKKIERDDEIAARVATVADKQEEVATEVATVKNTLENADETRTAQIAMVSQQLSQNTNLTQEVAATAAELHKQGNSRWDEIKKELHESKMQIAALQQLRLDDAKKGQVNSNDSH